MNYTWLRSFHAVAAEGGFTVASRLLNVGQPTITSQVKALEDYFAVQLFHRRGRSVALTDAGRDLFAITRRLTSLGDEARDLLNGYGGFHTGQLKVGAVGPYHATEMLSAFHDRYPDVRLTVTVGNSKEMVQRLLDYEADVGVLAHNFTHNGMAHRVGCPNKAGLAGHAGHIEIRRLVDRAEDELPLTHHCGVRSGTCRH